MQGFIYLVAVVSTVYIIVMAALFVGSSAVGCCNRSQGENCKESDEGSDLFQLSSYLHWRKGESGGYCFCGGGTRLTRHLEADAILCLYWPYFIINFKIEYAPANKTGINIIVKIDTRLSVSYL